ncbi:MAG: ATP-binding cassette domain-containing protein [Chitinophagales bacterium]|nr:ATP-binding cassette domain-containing protein [Chitinophagales bacterium]
MKIIISNAGKRFNFEWIFKNINYTFTSGNSYALLGPNGSGKSTLLQLISGSTSTSAGSIDYYHNEKQIDDDKIFNYLTIAAPYLELIEEFTATEMIQFQNQFKLFLKGITIEEVLQISMLNKDANKQIRNFSSGMKQRLKISLAVLADVPIILLDEPTTNLDQQGFEWYLKLMKEFSADRLIIICSNLEREIVFCNEKIDVMNFKQ